MVEDMELLTNDLLSILSPATNGAHLIIPGSQTRAPPYRSVSGSLS